MDNGKIGTCRQGTPKDRWVSKPRACIHTRALDPLTPTPGPIDAKESTFQTLRSAYSKMDMKLDGTNSDARYLGS